MSDSKPYAGRKWAAFLLISCFPTLGVLLLLAVDPSASETFLWARLHQRLVGIGLDTPGIWSSTGALAAIGVAISVVLVAAGRGVQSSYKNWEESGSPAMKPGELHEPLEAELARASKLFVTHCLFSVLLVFFGLTAGIQGAWAAAAIVTFLLWFISVEGLRFFHDMHVASGYEKVRERERLVRKIARVRALPAEDPVPGILWWVSLLTCSLVWHHRLSPTLPSNPVVWVALVCSIAAILIPGLLLGRLGSRATGALERVFSTFAYVFFALGAAAIVAFSQFTWVYPFHVGFSPAGVFWSLAVIALLGLYLIGFQGCGPLKSNARGALQELQVTLDAYK